VDDALVVRAIVDRPSNLSEGRRDQPHAVTARTNCKYVAPTPHNERHNHLPDTNMIQYSLPAASYSVLWWRKSLLVVNDNGGCDSDTGMPDTWTGVSLDAAFVGAISCYSCRGI
jgi:hypothetical protein